jgi:hypothetical protein
VPRLDSPFIFYWKSRGLHSSDFKFRRGLVLNVKVIDVVVVDDLDRFLFGISIFNLI